MGCFSKFDAFAFYETGKKWHSRRKIITPAFHFNMLDKFVKTFDRLGNKVIEKIDEHNSSRVDDGIEFFNLVGLYTLDVIGGMCKRNVDFAFIHFE